MTSEKPMMALSGVRSSWLMLAEELALWRGWRARACLLGAHQLLLHPFLRGDVDATLPTATTRPNRVLDRELDGIGPFALPAPKIDLAGQPSAGLDHLAAIASATGTPAVSEMSEVRRPATPRPDDPRSPPRPADHAGAAVEILHHHSRPARVP